MPQADKPQLVEVMSNSKVCPRCMKFCFEVKPKFKYGQAAVYFARGGRLPQTKVYCKICNNKRLPNGDEWGWLDVTDNLIPKNVHLEYDMRNVRRGRRR